MTVRPWPVVPGLSAMMLRDGEFRSSDLYRCFQFTLLDEFQQPVAIGPADGDRRNGRLAGERSAEQSLPVVEDDRADRAGFGGSIHLFLEGDSSAFNQCDTALQSPGWNVTFECAARVGKHAGGAAVHGHRDRDRARRAGSIARRGMEFHVRSEEINSEILERRLVAELVELVPRQLLVCGALSGADVSFE